MYLRFLKLRSVFLIGFGIGFSLAVILLSIQDTYSNISSCRKSSASQQVRSKDIFPEFIILNNWPDKEISLRNWDVESPSITYNEWFKEKHFERTNITLDKYLYGPGKKEKLESNWLKSNIHITCVVFVKKIQLARSVKNTWGQQCNDVYFFGQHLKDPDVPIINIDIKFVSSWQFLCEALNYIWKESSTLEWLIIVKDDTIVIPDNLRFMVAPLNHTDGHYLGHTVVMWGQPYNVAQAGYVISKGALEKLMKMFDSSQKCTAGGKYWKQEDFYLAKHLSSMGIHPSDTRDEYFSGTFHGYTLQNLLWGTAKPGSYWTHAVYPIHERCCSPMTVTFSAGDHDKMYTLYYLLYHLHVLKGESVFGTKKAPMSIPEEEVWRIALKEEFNITYLNEISSDAYYEIWHSKYSEPGELIVKNY